jgi:putative membrane protein
MRGLIIRWLVSALALWLTSALVPGIEVRSGGALLAAAAMIGILNAFVRPVIVLLTLPLTVLTLGLFVLVINAAMLKIASDLVPGFIVRGWFAAFAGWLLLSFFTVLINVLIGETGIEIVRVRHIGGY